MPETISWEDYNRKFGYYATLGYYVVERYRGWTLVAPNGWRFECTWYHEILDAARDFEAHYKFSRKPSGVDQQMNEEKNKDD